MICRDGSESTRCNAKLRDWQRSWMTERTYRRTPMIRDARSLRNVSMCRSRSWIPMNAPYPRIIPCAINVTRRLFVLIPSVHTNVYAQEMIPVSILLREPPSKTKPFGTKAQRNKRIGTNGRSPSIGPVAPRVRRCPPRTDVARDVFMPKMEPFAAGIFVVPWIHVGEGPLRRTIVSPVPNAYEPHRRSNTPIIAVNVPPDYWVTDIRADPVSIRHRNRKLCSTELHRRKKLSNRIITAIVPNLSLMHVRDSPAVPVCKEVEKLSVPYAFFSCTGVVFCDFMFGDSHG